MGFYNAWFYSHSTEKSCIVYSCPLLKIRMYKLPLYSTVTQRDTLAKLQEAKWYSAMHIFVSLYYRRAHVTLYPKFLI